MSGYGCPDCGGSGGGHYDGCIYEGTGGYGGGSYNRAGSEAAVGSAFKFLFVIIAIIASFWGIAFLHDCFKHVSMQMQYNAFHKERAVIKEEVATEEFSKQFAADLQEALPYNNLIQSVIIHAANKDDIQTSLNKDYSWHKYNDTYYIRVVLGKKFENYSTKNKDKMLDEIQSWSYRILQNYLDQHSAYMADDAYDPYDTYSYSKFIDMKVTMVSPYYTYEACPGSGYYKNGSLEGASASNYSSTSTKASAYSDAYEREMIRAAAASAAKNSRKYSLYDPDDYADPYEDDYDRLENDYDDYWDAWD